MNLAVLRARLRRWCYLLTEGMFRGECAVDITDDRTRRLLVLGSGRPTSETGIYSNYRIFWERKPLRVRWIETRGCMAYDYKTQNGIVLREYMKPADPSAGLNKDRLFLEIKLENGDGIHFPKEAFYKAPDGVLEYRY